MNGHRGARPYRRWRRARHGGDAGVGSGCGRVAAATGTGGVGFTSCRCVAASSTDAVKLVGRLRALGVSTRVRPPSSAQKSSRSDRYALRLAAATPKVRPLPQEARERLERALCGVLERRYPGRRFAMKDQLDTLTHRPAAARTTAANTDGLKDAA